MDIEFNLSCRSHYLGMGSRISPYYTLFHSNSHDDGNGDINTRCVALLYYRLFYDTFIEQWTFLFL